MAQESDLKQDPASLFSTTLQGMENAHWFTPAESRLARETNDIVLAIASRELEPGLAVTDFSRLLAEAARRAEADADR